MKRLTTLGATLGFFGLPLLAYAQYAAQGTGQGGPRIDVAQNLFVYVLNILNFYVVPLIFALAFIFFLVNVYRYFIAGGGNEEKIKEGRTFVMWALIGFFIMFSIWGLINLLINTLGFGGASQPGIPTFSTYRSQNSGPVGSGGSSAGTFTGSGGTSGKTLTGSGGVSGKASNATPTN